jgi:hypothetical protein
LENVCAKPHKLDALSAVNRDVTSVHLPVAHTEDDIQLAGALAQVLHSAELYVAWSTDGGAARPVIDAHLQFHPVFPTAARLQRPSVWQRLLDYWRGL